MNDIIKGVKAMNEGDITRKINDYVKKYEDEIIDLAQNLIKIPSENIAPNGFEKDAQLFLLDKLKEINGIEVDSFTPIEVEGIEKHPAYFKGREYKDRPNVVALKRGSGRGKSVIFSSHIDTVTRNPLPWDTGDPFSGKIVDGKLFGRGSFDMKGILASTVILLKIISDNKIELKGDLIVESVVDEENGGSNGTLASRLRGYNGDVAILPEPSLLTMCPACQGGKAYRVKAEGRAGTGYGGEKLVNPVYGLGALMKSINEYEKEINIKADPKGIFYKEEEKPRTVILDKVQAGDLKPGGNVGVPDSAWFSIFINTLPGYSEEDLDSEFNNFINKVARENSELFPQPPKIEGLTRYLWPYETDPNHPVVSIMKDGLKSFRKEKAVVEGAKFACDGFIFNKYFSIPTIVFGPRGGNAHAQDEYVLVEDLLLLTKVFLYVALKWCKGNLD